MDNTLTKIAAIQMASGPQIQANLMACAKLIRQAADNGAQMAALPENFALMPMKETENRDIAERFGQGRIQDFISDCARRNQIWVMAGSIPLKMDDNTAGAADRVTASSILFDANGKSVARYDKIHLFDVSFDGAKDGGKDNGADNGKTRAMETYHESAIFSPGSEVVVVDTPFGKIGLSICYDLRFPILYRKMVSAGAEIFMVPAAFTAVTGREHWEPLLRARAIENQCYVIAPAQGGYHVNGRNTYGHSMVIDYWGRVHETLEKGAGGIMIDIDLKAQRATRKNFPVLQHRKF